MSASVSSEPRDQARYQQAEHKTVLSRIGLRRVATFVVLALLGGLSLGGCTDTSIQPTYLYGQRPAEMSYPNAPHLAPWQQVQGFFTDPYYWPPGLDPTEY